MNLDNVGSNPTGSARYYSFTRRETSVRYKLLLVLTMLSVLFELVIASPATSHQTTISKGIAAGGSEPWSTTRLADYQEMKAAGADRIRMDMSWDYVQPTSGAFNWTLVDPTVADANAAGLKYLGILHRTPGWANNNRGDYAPPNRLSLYENYCYQTVKRYLPRGVNEYEIGNEVNWGHPGWTKTGYYYVRNLLTPCSAGVKRAAQELQLPVTILMGALAPPSTGETNPVTFLRDVYNNGGASKFDYLSYHPYTTDPLTHSNMNSVANALNNVTVSKTGSSRQIWATEYGAPTGGDVSVTEARQAELVTEAFAAWFSHSYAGPLLWYSHRDRGNGTDREDHFGLLRADGSHKPSYDVYQSVS